MTRGFIGGMITGGLIGMAVGMMMLPEFRGNASEQMMRGTRAISQRAHRVWNRAGSTARQMMPEEH